VVSSVGFVSTFSFSLKAPVPNFEWLNLRKIDMCRFTVFSIHTNLWSFAAVLIMPNIVVCLIHPTCRIMRYSHTQPFQACLVSQLANVYLICVFLCPSIIQIKEYGSNTPNSPEFRNAFKSQKRGRTRLHLPLSTGTDSLALESSGVEILGLLDRGRPF